MLRRRPSNEKNGNEQARVLDQERRSEGPASSQQASNQERKDEHTDGILEDQLQGPAGAIPLI